MLLSSCAGPKLEPVTGEEHGDPQLLSEVDGLVRTVMRKNHIPGLSITVVHEGTTVVLRGYGAADLDNDVPVTPDTVFRAYSIAKLFTGLEVVRLAQEGRIDLDAPLREAVPEWSGMRYSEPGGAITVRQLLAHRGGLPRNSNFHPEGGVSIDEALRGAVESLAGAPAAYPPGERHKYSNVGYNVLGRAVEVARNQSFAVYMTYDALPDYGMKRSAYFTGFLPDDAQTATGYVREKRRFRPTELFNLNELASGNLFTSASDMAAFMKTILETTEESGGPLLYTSLRASFAPQYASADDPERTGLAWATSEALAGERMVWHQGGDADANALVALFPDSRTGVCLLSNSGSYEGVKLLSLAVDCLRAVRANQGIPEPERPVPVATVSDEPEPEQVAGRYVAYGKLMTIKSRGVKLKADFGIASLRMQPAGRTERGMEYTLSHWLGGLISGAFPIDLKWVRIIVPPLNPGEQAGHVWFAASDCAYEYCPRYPVPQDIPKSWYDTAGDYAGCTVTLKDSALHMSGVGYLHERAPGLFEVVGGVYDGETVARDPATGALAHQGFVYDRK
ncbi:MAG TPA: serine hydrolase domain-containing protein [Pontiella sp.]|nr:serine hydrolase domain-containing protein [Pontiella sp.]